MRLRLTLASAVAGLATIPFTAHAGCTTTLAQNAAAQTTRAVTAFVSCAV
jgi:hypothetical protein